MASLGERFGVRDDVSCTRNRSAARCGASLALSTPHAPHDCSRGWTRGAAARVNRSALPSECRPSTAQLIAWPRLPGRQDERDARSGHARACADVRVLSERRGGVRRRGTHCARRLQLLLSRTPEETLDRIQRLLGIRRTVRERQLFVRARSTSKRMKRFVRSSMSTHTVRPTGLGGQLRAATPFFQTPTASRMPQTSP